MVGVFMVFYMGDADGVLWWIHDGCWKGEEG